MSERTENGKSKVIPRCPSLCEWWCRHKIVTGTGEAVLHRKESNPEHAPAEVRNGIRAGGSGDLG